jgi:hypothetical protein
VFQGQPNPYQQQAPLQSQYQAPNKVFPSQTSQASQSSSYSSQNEYIQPQNQPLSTTNDMLLLNKTIDELSLQYLNSATTAIDRLIDAKVQMSANKAVIEEKTEALKKLSVSL